MSRKPPFYVTYISVLRQILHRVVRAYAPYMRPDGRFPDRKTAYAAARKYGIPGIVLCPNFEKKYIFTPYLMYF